MKVKTQREQRPQEFRTGIWKAPFTVLLLSSFLTALSCSKPSPNQAKKLITVRGSNPVTSEHIHVSGAMTKVKRP